MSRYALRSRRNTVATGPALPRVESPLSELSGELSPDIRNTKIPAESSTASAQGSAPGPAASRVPASGNAALRNPPSAHVQAEEEKSSPSDSEDDEDVSSQGNLTAAGISKKNLSRSNVEYDDESDTSSSSSSMESKKASSKTDAEEPTPLQPARPARLRRTQSLDDLSRNAVRFKEQHKAKKLTKEQASTVRAAERNLTTEQREILAKRQDKVAQKAGSQPHLKPIMQHQAQAHT
ncbi:uncharacterized protein EV420DRAFT_1648989, partial [Desarmillaria tabescens]